jgi:AP-1 complex subunit mu
MKFHQCVKLSQYERDRPITFIPPDGKFNLLKYRVSSAVPQVIYVESLVERYEGSRVELFIRARSDFRPQSVAQSVLIRVPVPPDVDPPMAQCSTGKMKYSPKDNCLIWTIKQFPLKAYFGLPSVESEDEDSRRSISVEFEIPYFTVSGLRVQYLKVLERSDHEAVNWVRYMTFKRTYEFRTEILVRAFLIDELLCAMWDCHGNTLRTQLVWSDVIKFRSAKDIKFQIE